jgi:putative multiple sugar transport system permease protein
MTLPTKRLPNLAGEGVHMSFRALLRAQLHNIRDYGMYVAFVVIVLIFTILTDGRFLSSRNIGNLVNATSYIAVLAVGMTLVIVIRHIDLSVGFLAGTLGAVAAYSLRYWLLPASVTIPIVLALGIVAGMFTGFLVAYVRIPAFVATLAGWLGYRGALQLVTRRTGTIIINDEGFNALGNGFIPDIPGTEILPGIHIVTLLLGVVAIAAFVAGEISNRRKTQAYNFEVLPLNAFVIKLVFVSAIIAGITWVLAGYRGLSWAAVVLSLVVLSYSYVTTKTVIGRHVYAVGGNPEAAELNGISVRKITLLVFGSMGFLTGVSGILYASWLRSATTIAGTGMELDAIAAAFVGGVAVSGGVGKVTGSILGALVMASLTNGMNLLGVDLSWQYIVRAGVLAVAVIFDVLTRRTGPTR